MSAKDISLFRYQKGTYLNNIIYTANNNLEPFCILNYKKRFLHQNEFGLLQNH